MATPATNELVMSNEEMTAALEVPEPQGESAEPDDLGTDGGDDVPATWEDREGDEDEQSAEDGTPPRKSAPDVREYKANGKVHKVDMSDRKAVDQLLTLGLGARPVFTERDQLRKTLKARDVEVTGYKQKAELFDKLESLKSDHDGLYERIFGKKFSEAAKARADEQAQYEAASPEERRYMDLRRQVEEDRRKADQASKARDEAEKALETRQQALDLKELKSQMTPEFMKYEFSDKVQDEGIAARMNKALWKMTISELREQYGDNEEIPQQALRKAFRDTHDLLWSNHKQVAEAEVKKITTTKKQNAKEQAATASTRNYGSGGNKTLGDLAKEKDPVKLWKKMFR